MIFPFSTPKSSDVRPLAGAGIEITLPDALGTGSRFAPSRGRELKSRMRSTPRSFATVRPLAGAGIEITGGYDSETDDEVRPLAGAGIEI